MGKIDQSAIVELAPHGDERVLHIRCGTDIQETLPAAGFGGDFLAFYDPYAHGPLPATDSLDEFLEVRAGYISAGLHPDHDEVINNLHQQYAALERVCDYDVAYLWFEHDSFDQLILAKLLDVFGDAARRPRRLQLVSVTHFPGVDKFIGIGQLTPEQLLEVSANFSDVTAEQYALGQTVWAALCSPTADALHDIIASGTPALPTMAIALQRHLKELPAEHNGLSLAEDLTLQILQKEGGMSAAQLFNWYTNHYEPLPFMGDSSYWLLLAGLATSNEPAIRLDKQGENPDQWHVELNDLGAQLLAGEVNWIDLNGIDRWVGGIHLNR